MKSEDCGCDEIVGAEELRFAGAAPPWSECLEFADSLAVATGGSNASFSEKDGFAIALAYQDALIRGYSWLSYPPNLPGAEASVEPVVDNPVEPVVEAPVEPVVEAPVEPVVEAPVELVVEAPVEPVVEAPVEPVVDAPVEPVVDTPVESVVEAPVEPVVDTPVEPDGDNPDRLTTAGERQNLIERTRPHSSASDAAMAEGYVRMLKLDSFDQMTHRQMLAQLARIDAADAKKAIAAVGVSS
ncbi:MAG: hypothetical protein ABJZ55_20350 [Fuerstiella sp.]